tara:strand:+ start:120 stop:800 length:681 start_codon:yes stop_codon:yes gene_type:complete
LAKRITAQQKEEIIKLFISGTNLELISKKFNFTKLTISRNLKKNLGEVAYEEYLAISKSNNKLIKYKKLNTNNTSKNDNKNNVKAINHDLNENSNTDIEEQFFKTSEFIEIAPLNYDIEDKPQMDLSSIPIADIDFPKIVFMIVDKKVELEIKYLKDYSKWHFLSKEELERKTIEIYYDLKTAKSFCSKEQKVIKVPNATVFKKVAPILLSRGISRIVSSDKLIAL